MARTNVAPVPVITPMFDWRDVVAAAHLARAIAEIFNLDIKIVWAWMCTIPNNDLVLLDAPSGWTAIADWVADRMTGGAPRDLALTPTIH